MANNVDASGSKAIKTTSTPSVETSASGIPKAPFIEDVEAHLGGPEEEAEPHLRKFQETMSKYKMMEMDRKQRQRALQEKIPDIEKTLNMVQHLQSKKEAEEELETHFELNDTLYARATIPPVESVNLWLGANVMLSYPIQEAIELLTKRLQGSKDSLKLIGEDLEFLRDQITTMEVNTARVHNWDVKRRREKRLAAEKAN